MDRDSTIQYRRFDLRLRMKSSLLSEVIKAYRDFMFLQELHLQLRMTQNLKTLADLSAVAAKVK